MSLLSLQQLGHASTNLPPYELLRDLASSEAAASPTPGSNLAYDTRDSLAVSSELIWL